MNEQIQEVEVVDRPASLAVFDSLKASVAEYKAKNESMVFDYATQEKEVRSHCYQLRQIKGQAKTVHTKAKAKALAECQMIDGAKNEIFGAVDEMVEYHMKPIREIAEAKQAEIDAKLKAEAEEKARIEQERLDAIAKEEERLAAERKAFEAEKAAAAKAEEERLAKVKAEVEARNRVMKAEEGDRLAAIKKEEERIAAERAKLDKEKAAEAKAEQDRLDAIAEEKAAEEHRIAAEKAEAERLERVEAERVADLKHCKKIEDSIYYELLKYVDSESEAGRVLQAIGSNKIPNVTITY